MVQAMRLDVLVKVPVRHSVQLRSEVIVTPELIRVPGRQIVGNEQLFSLFTSVNVPFEQG